MVSFGYSDVVDNIWMIQMSDNPISQHYKNIVLPSWKYRGYDVKEFEAITPETLPAEPLRFSKCCSAGTPWPGRGFTDTERAVWYSHYLLWVKCAEMGKPILVIEHDTLLLRDLPRRGYQESVLGLGKVITEKGRVQRWPAGAYYIPPIKAKQLIFRAKGSIIDCNVDGFINSHLRTRKNLWVCLQIIDNDIGTTIHHDKETDIPSSRRGTF